MQWLPTDSVSYHPFVRFGGSKQRGQEVVHGRYLGLCVAQYGALSAVFAADAIPMNLKSMCGSLEVGEFVAVVHSGWAKLSENWELWLMGSYPQNEAMRQEKRRHWRVGRKLKFMHWLLLISWLVKTRGGKKGEKRRRQKVFKGEVARVIRNIFSSSGPCSLHMHACADGCKISGRLNPCPHAPYLASSRSPSVLNRLVPCRVGPRESYRGEVGEMRVVSRENQRDS